MAQTKITKESIEKEVITRGKLEPIVADLKDFIKSTAKGTETYLMNEIQGVRNELKNDMQNMEKRLSAKIDGINKRVDNHDTRISALEETMRP